MQDRYVGDIGDYAKYSLLNALSTGRSLGVAWYMFPDEGHNNDGKHIGYLRRSDEWASRDPSVFFGLKQLIDSGSRSLYAIKKAGFLNAVSYADEILSHQSQSFEARSNWRKSWFNRVLSTLSHCDLVFADPDNGICLDSEYKFGNRKMWKRIPETEVNTLASMRPALIYHHNTRRKGGHAAENEYWMKKLSADMAIRVRYANSRTFFLINSNEELQLRAEQWVRTFSLGTDKIQVLKR